MSNFHSDYRDWERRFPTHVIIMKDGSYYNSLGYSASAVHGILGYKLFKDGLNKIRAGGPNLEKIISALQSHHFSYIAIDNNKIITKKLFLIQLFLSPSMILNHAATGQRKSKDILTGKNQILFLNAKNSLAQRYLN